MEPTTAAPAPISFETHPSRYRHWKLEVLGDVARLLDGRPGGRRPASPATRSSSTATTSASTSSSRTRIQRLRFEHPEVQALVVTSRQGPDLLRRREHLHARSLSSHAFKVNFCKFTNETRLGLEEPRPAPGIRSLCALNGTASGGGYELALACDEIVLVDDGSSAVRLPEVPLLGVLPGTGGLTRVVDKRKVRRDLADVFSTIAEGVRGKRAVEWRLVDEVVAPLAGSTPGSAERAAALAGALQPRRRPGGRAAGAARAGSRADAIDYRHVTLKLDRTRRARRS